MKAKILTLDLETAPSEVYVFGLKDQNIGVEQIKHDAYCLMWAARWLGEKVTLSDTLVAHPSSFTKNRRCDRQIALSLHKVMCEADIIITQNGDSFDLKWANTLFLKHGLDKPSPFHSIDLLKHSRNSYYSISHRLDFRGRQLGLGRKMSHEGFRLWLDCMRGDLEAWNTMERYCKRDVELTEQYYLKLRPHMRNHPNVNMFHEPAQHGGRLKCPACGSSNLKKKGFRYWIIGRKQRFKCMDCSHWMVMQGAADTTTKQVFKSD